MGNRPSNMQQLEQIESGCAKAQQTRKWVENTQKSNKRANTGETRKRRAYAQNTEEQRKPTRRFAKLNDARSLARSISPGPELPYNFPTFGGPSICRGQRLTPDCSLVEYHSFVAVSHTSSHTNALNGLSRDQRCLGPLHHRGILLE